jgi:apolipoprotein N-acyltransferase
MAQCILRCVENRVPAIRSANTGVTCYIDARGRVLDGMDRLVAGFKTMQVTLAPDEMALTCYTRYGDWFGGLSAALTLIGMLYLKCRNQIGRLV